MWQNNLLKYYMEYDIDKACDYGEDLMTEPGLSSKDSQDLKFSLAVSAILTDVDELCIEGQ